MGLAAATSSRRAIRRIAIGRLVSVTGEAATYVALGFTIWEQTHSPLMQSLSLLLTVGATGLLGPLAGMAGDRFDRRRVMVLSALGSGALMGAMVLVERPGVLIALAFGSALAGLPFLSASRAAIPSLVADEAQLPWANSLISLGTNAGVTIGPVLGGVLLAMFGASWLFGLDALLLIGSAIITLTVHAAFQDRRGEALARAGAAAGVVFLWRDRVLRRLSLAMLVLVVGMGMAMVADAPLADRFHAGSLGFGLLIACWGFGSVWGSAGGRWMNARNELILLPLLAFGTSATAFGVGVATRFGVVLGASLLMGTCDGLAIVAESSVMQRRTPDAVRSRTFAAYDAFVSVGLLIAYLLGGPVLGIAGPQVAYRIGGCTALIGAVMLLPIRRLASAPIGSFDAVEPV